MAARLDLSPHKSRKVAGERRFQPAGVVPYIRLRVGEDPPIYLQNGCAFPESGEAYSAKELPEWFWEQAALLSKEAKEKVRFAELEKQRKG